jgi:hypothetical protein
VRVEHVEVHLAVGDELAHGGGVLGPHRLHHAAAGLARGLAAVDRALVAVELEHRERRAVGHVLELVEWPVHEHADDLGLALELTADQLGRARVARARALRVEDHAHGPGAQLDG